MENCEHEWFGVLRSKIYNPNGEYVEGYGWTTVFIPAEPTEFRCKKCKMLRRIDSEGEIFYYPSKSNPLQVSEP